jgi:alkanesulfonate monooxygenase SsuD/methylene tetrahydromethanopterin reductase-like flavin-dependent oxidoreductase (luciferase family)
MARGRGILLRTAEKHGRDGDQIVVAVEKLATIAHDRDTAMERALPTVRTSSKTYERDVADMQFALDRHIFGDVDDVKRRVAEFVDAGVTHFELKLLYSSIDELVEQLELWSEYIIPEYR